MPTTASPKSLSIKNTLFAIACALASSTTLAECAGWMDHSIGKLHSQQTLDLCQLTEGKTVLVVNTASKCGFTPQFKGLQALYERYKAQDFIVVGFPSNSFRQAARDEEEAAEICYVNFGVTFPMTSTVSVRGENAHPIFKHLAEKISAPNWNFNKYLVSSSGAVLGHFGSSVSPDSKELTQAIESAL